MTFAQKFGSLITVFSLAGAMASLNAATIPVSYHFGTDPGKVTPAFVGFVVDDSAPIVTASNVENGIRFSTENTGNANGFFLQTFSNIGGSNTTNFTISTDIRLAATTGGDSRRFGIALFSEGGDTGISAQVHRNASNDWTIRFRDGLNGSIIDNSEINFNTKAGDEDPTRNENYSPGDTFALTVTATYLTGNDLRLDMTVSDSLGYIATTTATIDRTAFTSQQFGGSTRARGYDVDFENFAIIPEPSSLALVVVALGAAAGFRRSRP